MGCHRKETITNEEVIDTDAKDLQIGMRVKLFLHKKKTDKHPAGYKKVGILTVHSMNDRMLVLKSGSGYIETISMIDLRQGNYRVQLEDGTDIRFAPMVDVMKIERERVDHDIEEYRNTIDASHRRAQEKRKDGTAVTKDKVKELWDQGKTPDEIVQELNSTSWIVKGMLTKMGLLDKVGSHDEREEKTNMKREALKIDRMKAINICLKYGTGVAGQKKIAEEFGVDQKQAEGYVYNHIKREVDRIQKQQKENTAEKPAERSELNEMIASKINSHEEHPEQITQATTTQESSPEAQLNPIDVESSPARHKTRYYIATGFQYMDRAEQLAEVLEAAGGEITCKWWNPLLADDREHMEYVASREFQGIKDCDVFIALLPGFDGTYSEIGAAAALGKKVIVHTISEPCEKYNPAPCLFLKNVIRMVCSELHLVAEILKTA